VASGIGFYGPDCQQTDSMKASIETKNIDHPFFTYYQTLGGIWSVYARRSDDSAHSKSTTTTAAANLLSRYYSRTRQMSIGAIFMKKTAVFQ